MKSPYASKTTITASPVFSGNIRKWILNGVPVPVRNPTEIALEKGVIRRRIEDIRDKIDNEIKEVWDE